ncbi:hypothetical protein QEE_0182 [Clostridioides difficile CD113]|nr:hypothetical protein QEE_0182 [Clostridioides difficile CD113]
MGRNSRNAGVPSRVAHWGFGASSAPSRPKAATPPAGRTHRQRCISAPLSQGSYPASPVFADFAATSPAPGRRERTSRNAPTSSPVMAATAGKTLSRMAPRSMRRCVRALRSALAFLLSRIFWRFWSWCSSVSIFRFSSSRFIVPPSSTSFF